MGEILIPHPETNTEVLRNYSFHNPDVVGLTHTVLKIFDLTPHTHPHVADLCAGDGSIARLLIDAGWKPEEIVCVDQYVSPTPLVHGVTWRYWDLTELAWAIKSNNPLPPEITHYHRSFNIVAEIQGYLSLPDSAIVCRYFAGNRGVIYSSNLIEMVKEQSIEITGVPPQA